MSSPRSVTFIFDFDGTLADTLEQSRLVGNDLAPWFGLDRISPSAFEALRHLTLAEIQSHLGIPAWKVPLFLFFFRRRMLAVLRDLNCIPGMPETLLELHQGSVRLGVLTSNNFSNVTAFLEHHQLLPLFDFIHGGVRILGKAQRLRSLMERYNLNPSNTYYVGDEIRDVIAAHHAGLKAIAVGWGFNTPEALEVVQPDFLIQYPKDLVKLVES